VILVFFSLISAYGFIRLIVYEEKKASAYWAAYGGAGLAFAAKGLLPLVLVAFAWGFTFFTKRSLKRLVHIPSMLFAVAAVVAWFGYSYLAHGDSALNVFWGDQVAKKVTSLWAPFYRIPLFLLIYVLNFLPWSLPVIESRLRNRNAFNSEDKAQKGFRQFAVAWAVTIAVIFGFGKNVSIRYLLPATPLLAMCLADVLYRSASAKLIFSPANLLKFMLALLVIVGALAFWINWQLEAVTYATIALILVLAMIFSLGWLGLVGTSKKPKIALAFSIFLLFPTLFASLYHVVFPDEAQEITRKLMDSSIASGEPILVINDLSLANRIRVYSRGQIEVRKAKFLDPATVPTYAGIVSWGDQTEQLRALGFDIQKISTAIKTPHAEDLLKAGLTGKLRELRESRKMDYFLAIPQNRVAKQQS
jgi:4-amino-4-deoxy-L-arabinose transferase-like glycosyltransferase